MKRIYFLISILILILSNTAIAQTVIVNSFTIEIQRSSDGYDNLLSEKDGKRIDSLKLNRLDAGPQVLKLEKVKDASDYVLVDYFQGSEGTSVMKECYEATLVRIKSNGKIKLGSAQSSGSNLRPLQKNRGWCGCFDHG